MIMQISIRLSVDNLLHYHTYRIVVVSHPDYKQKFHAGTKIYTINPWEKMVWTVKGGVRVLVPVRNCDRMSITQIVVSSPQ